ncbi:MAG: hypothetical protein K0Q87_4675 [Neobacillus sp.]|nr:hypothetical protein [Neobacillus sp.]
MVIILMISLFILTIIPSDDNSSYEEYCRMECWSRKNYCCN